MLKVSSSTSHAIIFSVHMTCRGFPGTLRHCFLLSATEQQFPTCQKSIWPTRSSWLAFFNLHCMTISTLQSSDLAWLYNWDVQLKNWIKNRLASWSVDLALNDKPQWNKTTCAEWWLTRSLLSVCILSPILQNKWGITCPKPSVSLDWWAHETVCMVWCKHHTLIDY